MSHIESLIKSFSVSSLQTFFRQNISTFKADNDDFDYLFKDKIFDKYESITKIGEATIENDEVVFIASKTNDPLTERSGKKKQYEIAKRILKNENVDAALFVFYDANDNFRFSFVKANYLGNKRDYTDFKRYSYFVSPKLTNKTFIKQVGNCTFNSIDEIIKSFSVEPLNKDFYQEIAKAFYGLIGGKIKINTKEINHQRILQLPSVDANDGKKFQEFAVRLIGRTIFCWFLKNKKSVAGKALIPEEWLSSEKVIQCGSDNYYHTILEKLFFLILNKKVDDRKPYSLPNGHEDVPFLNGGLFEAQEDDFFPKNGKGIHQFLANLIIPNEWFENLFKVLEQYNFTIDENSINDSEVSIDPEMLGTIFENLLAEIDPDTEKSARKSTGSFYTPREIVDYMVEQSLLNYLRNKTAIDDEELLQSLFKEGTENPFDDKTTKAILQALSDVKILDPACGSGAFPMGALHKIIVILKKLDKGAEWWKQKQLEKIDNAIVRRALKEKLDHSTSDYARKLGVIQHSIYGVDIQPIASEISKLRSFLSLIIDENIDDNAENRGVEPLPNLEFKFVTANTLIGLDEGSSHKTLAFDFGETEVLQKKLQEIRADYLQTSGEEKEKLKKQFEKIQQEIFKNELESGGVINKRAQQLVSWKPFTNNASTWFDSLWMFGVEKFDLIIGNPPYVYTRDVNFGDDFKDYVNKQYFSKLNIPNKLKSKSNQSGKINLFALFVLNGKKIINQNGNLIYIIPNNFLRGTVFDTIRYDILKNNNIISIVDLGAGVFDKVTASTILIQIGNQLDSIETKVITEVSSLSNGHYSLKVIDKNDFLKNTSYTFNIMLNEEELKLSNKIKSDKNLFGEYCIDIIEGIVAHKHLIIDKKQQNTFELLEGKDIKRFKINEASNHILWDLKNIHRKRPDYLWEEPKKIIMQRISGGKMPLVAAIDKSKRKSFASVNNIVLKNEFKEHYEYFNALLNSKVINWFYANNFSNNSNLTVNISKTFLETLPIKLPNKTLFLKIKKLVEDLENVLDSGKFETMYSELNTIFYKVYELSHEEILLIDPEFNLTQSEYDNYKID